MVCLGASSNWLVYNTHSEYLDRGVVKDFGVNGSEEIMLTARVFCMHAQIGFKTVLHIKKNKIKEFIHTNFTFFGYSFLKINWMKKTMIFREKKISRKNK